MKVRYGIGFLVAILACIAVFSGAYYYSYQGVKQKQQAALEEKQRLEAEAELKKLEKEQAIAAEGDASKASAYYLMELNGYVVVYLSDKTTVYEYTNIAVEHLPEEIREEIDAGKEIATDEELYGFLENYSS